MLKLLHRALESPIVFELHQNFANDYEKIAVEFAPYLESSRPLDILDVGCSTGTGASKFVDMAKHRYCGIDISPAYVEQARARYPAARFEAMDARQMTFADKTFDLALFIAVLHHMDDDLARNSLAEAARVVKEGGHILVAEPIFTEGKWISTILLKMDRGNHIRSTEGYQKLLPPCEIAGQGYFQLSFHRCCSFVLRR